MIAGLMDRLRAILILVVLVGIVVLDSVSKIVSMCIDGFGAVILVALVWPLIKTKSSAAKP